MSSKLVPSDPASVMVIRDLTPNITTLSLPFARFGTVRVGGRATLVKLTSGEVAVFSPVALTDAVKAKVAEMGGAVHYIIAPDIEHHLFISEWAAAWPAALIVGPEGLPEKRAAQKDERVGPEKFAHVYTAENHRELVVSEAFNRDFEVEFVHAHPTKEIVFFYKPDRTLIEADLFFNMPPTEQYSRVPAEQKTAPGVVEKLFAGAQTTDDAGIKWARRAQWYLFSRGNRGGFNDSLRRIDGWDFETVVPCHGDTMVGDGKERFRKVFEWHLTGKK